MTTTSPPGGDYDAYAEQYAPNVAWREQGGVEGDPFGILPPLLELLGDVSGHRVLDAGCGEGYLARALAARRAQVTGIDISPRLIELARKKNASDSIDHQVADLSQPIADRTGSFDAVASYLVLNDVPDYQASRARSRPCSSQGGERCWHLTTLMAALSIGTSPITSTPER